MEHFQEDGNASILHQNESVCGRARGNVGEYPEGLVLLGVFRSSQEVQEPGNDSVMVDLLYWRVLRRREHPQLVECRSVDYRILYKQLHSDFPYIGADLLYGVKCVRQPLPPSASAS